MIGLGLAVALALACWGTVAAQDEAAAGGETDTAVNADGSAKVFPWYGSLKKIEVNVRSGPGNQYPILWVYQRAGYPVQVLARYDNYYKLRDVEGEEGWVYVGMVSKRLTGLVGGKTPANLLRKPDNQAQVVARLAPGVVVELEVCESVNSGSFCKVIAQDTKGWVNKRALLMIE
jgi:SH3-like domain-containing protein